MKKKGYDEDQIVNKAEELLTGHRDALPLLGNLQCLSELVSSRP